MPASGYGGLKKGFERAGKTKDWVPGFPKETKPKPPSFGSRVKGAAATLKRVVSGDLSTGRIAKLKPQIAAKRKEVENIRARKAFDTKYGVGKKR